MSRNSWWSAMTVLEDSDRKSWWAIPSGLPREVYGQYGHGNPPHAPWVHTSHARGWPRCSICRAPLKPGSRCERGTWREGEKREHWTYPNYVAVAYTVKPWRKKPEKAVQVSPVTP